MLISSGSWFFPSNNHGIITGIHESGIETFQGSPVRSLTREICQNSLDARADPDKPVAVEFECCNIDISEEPVFAGLREAVQRCLQFWSDQGSGGGNTAAVSFLEHAEKVLAEQTIPVLRVSDRNTTGLLGSDKSFNSDWQNLIKASGISSKGDADGGSFGIGKSAPFTCSDLHTVFYSTLDRDGLKAFQGVAHLPSFPTGPSVPAGSRNALKKLLPGRAPAAITDRTKGMMTSGTGYFGKLDRLSPVADCLSLTRYKRTEPGTDLFILGFQNYSGWEQDVMLAALEEFLVAVKDGLLEVSVGGDTISSGSLSYMLQRLNCADTDLYQYYHALSTDPFNLPFAVPDADGKDIEEFIELHLMIGPNYNRRIMMCRKNGMKVFDMKGFPSAIQFTGVCILRGSSINAFFKKMENPQHNAWEYKRYREKPSLAKQQKTALFRCIRDQLLDLVRTKDSEELEAEGVGDYLPYNPDSESDSPVRDEQKKHIETIGEKSADPDPAVRKSLPKMPARTDISVLDTQDEDGRIPVLHQLKGTPDSRGTASDQTYEEKVNDLLTDAGEEPVGRGVNPESGSDAGEPEDSSGSEPEADGSDTPETVPAGSSDGSSPGVQNEPPPDSQFQPAAGLHQQADSGSALPYSENRPYAKKKAQIRLALADSKLLRYRLIIHATELKNGGFLLVQLSGEQDSVTPEITWASLPGSPDSELEHRENKIFLPSFNSDKAVIEFSVDCRFSSSMEVSLFGYS